MGDVHASDQRLLLRVGGVVAGEVHPSWLDLLSQADSPFLVPAERDGSGEVTLGAPAKKRDDALAACEALSAAVDAWARALHARDVPSGWRGERVLIHYRARPLVLIERAWLRPLGLALPSVQACVWRTTADGPRLWMARRSLSKSVDPGRLDALVAGGIREFDSPRDTLVRECAEEAGIPAELARKAAAVGELGIDYETLCDGRPARHREHVSLFELEVPAEFQPQAVDGEHAEILSMSPAEVMSSLGRDDWTPDGAQAMRALIERRGWRV
jgi:8-oxo-dGTP pyrophosphatase MutT (NUDIX family)